MINPIYIALAAITLDGKIAKDSQHLSTDWTSEEDKIFFRSFLKECDVVLVGNKTWQTAKEPLSKRNCIVLSRSAHKLISESATVTFCNPEKIDLKKFILDKGYKKVAVLGGSQVYTYCLENNMLDELYLTIEPLVFGKGINLFQSNDVLNTHFQLEKMEKLNNQGTILLKYKKNGNK
jgi:dihydrofolate reductase